MSISAEIEPRTYFSSLENALGDFQPPYEALPVIRDVARGLDYTHVFIPESRAHIGLEAAGGGEPIAYIFPGFIALHPRGGVSSFVELPQPLAEEAPAPATAKASRAAASSPAKAVQAEPVACAGCFTALPASGRCDYCD
ncbi:hypothetical protein [Demequina lignilytica]|uniref:Uncharacterized protein n=1 Tax=Demequina lignilytica TaxID=3051663 RepID=A0AB35MJN8_9MICO|nr:hypothetical protein [Demequina sp. SYSU T0a273]MDN4484031.1 hypothetical protein [Demequina sp. SYSU T0a273]